jgi:hypothetical protein
VLKHPQASKFLPLISSIAIKLEAIDPQATADAIVAIRKCVGIPDPVIEKPVVEEVATTVTPLKRRAIKAAA